jgi:hypothetical protein
MEGNIRKMVTKLGDKVSYELPLGKQLLAMNTLIGSQIKLTYLGEINCVHCNRKSNKSFAQGYCYPCFKKLAQCDLCIMKPEQCHYAAGTCREPEWGDEFCMQDHFVYLANSSGLKVGITRHTQIPTRWIDQGATQALPIFRVKTRLQSGQVEVILKQHVADKTDWRKMLKGMAEDKDLLAERDRLLAECSDEIAELSKAQAEGDIEFLNEAEVINITFPVLEYPEKVRSLNFDKTAEISGLLQGIKGQYLILDSGVLNLRKFGGYRIAVEQA